jgi:UDP-glucose 4-epimerase
MVFVSTFVYGIPEYLPIDEEHPVAPNNPYSQSKILSEELCEAYCRDYGLNIVILRLFNVYGPGQEGDFLIPKILCQLADGEVLIGDPIPRRDFLYIDDIVEALIAASRSSTSGCTVINIGSGISYSVEEIANKLAGIYYEQTGRNVLIKYMKDKRRGEIADTAANIEKAKNILKWTPKVDLDTGLYMTLRAYLDDYNK